MHVAVPLTPIDVQSMYLYVLLGSAAPRKPYWIQLKQRRIVSHTVLVVAHVDSKCTYEVRWFWENEEFDATF